MARAFQSDEGHVSALEVDTLMNAEVGSQQGPENQPGSASEADSPVTESESKRPKVAGISSELMASLRYDQKAVMYRREFYKRT